MKKKMVCLYLIFLFISCKSNKFTDSQHVSAVYLTVIPYTVSPFSINEIDIHFTDETTCSQLRIHGEDISILQSRINQLQPTIQNEVPKKYEKYVKVWIGLQFANEKKRLSLGITRDGLIKIGKHFYKKDDEILTIIFKQKIHPRILETIPKDSIWGKFLK